MAVQTEPWLANWELGDPLDGGGQGYTHHVDRREDQFPGVLKVLRFANDMSARSRMRHEVVNLETLRQLGASVPEVIESNVEDVEDLEVAMYFVMEYVDGPTLDAYVKDAGKLDTQAAIAIVRKIAETIAIGHREAILHRDIKPKNIVLRNSVDPVVVDYGLSFNKANDEGLTGTAETLWNEFLSCPETNVAGDDRRDHRTDVTALCGILYFCLTGFYPQLLEDSNRRPPHRRPNRTLDEAGVERSSVAQLNSLFYRGFASDKNCRFQSVEEFVATIESIRTGSSQEIAETPQEVAARESAIIAQHDRKTQLNDMRPIASEAWKTIVSALLPLFKNLGRFEVTTGGLSFDSVELPIGVDLLGRHQLVVSAKVSGHTVKRHLIFNMTARDNILVISEVVGSEDPKKKRFGGEWVSFPCGEPAVVQPVVDQVQRWLNRVLVELREELLGSSKP